MFSKSTIRSSRMPEAWDFDIARLPAHDMLARLESRETGLSDSEALKRIARYGYNEAAKKEKVGMLLEIFIRFTNPLVILLLIIGTFSAFFSDRLSAVIIFIMAVASVILSYIQEHKAERAADELNSLVKITADVRRGGRVVKKGIKHLVPGDVIELSAGDMVPADVRIIASKDLFINQAALTGESFPVEKFPEPAAASGDTAADSKATLALMGSSVTSGTGIAVVVFTGSNTEFGKISKNLVGQVSETSFDKGVREFTWLMIRSILLLVVVILVINLVNKNNFKEALLFALAVAVGLTPETLPMIVAINLSKGALEMSKKKVIVKRLNSIQNFGAMDVLCTDKTGTLTQDKVVLEKYCDVYGKEDDTVLNYGYMNSYYQTGLKNVLDKAILGHEHSHLHLFEKIDEVPFDFTRRIVSVAVRTDGHALLVAKGAPESVFERARFYDHNGEPKKITSAAKKKMLAEYESLSSQGFRVLAVAYKPVPVDQKVFSVKDEQGLTVKGFLAFLDPPKEGAREALDLLEERGIQLKVLTGDNEAVTEKICTIVDINVQGMLTGSEVEKLSDSELKKKIEEVTVFARLMPLQKERIVRLLHSNGHTVGFLGDGINDAPALKAADVGISVNNAVDVAKSSADIILLKKSLSVLVDGVAEGRRVFGNILKYIRMSSSSNFGNMFSMTVASLVLPFLPMAPIQILLNNFLYDISQAGISGDTVDEDYLEQPKPWNISLIKKFMVSVGPVSSLFDLVTFGVLWYGLRAYLSPELFHTGWFIESLITQTLVVYVIRTRKVPFLQSWPGRPLVLTTVFVMAAGLILPFTPLAESFGLVRLPGVFYLFLLAIVALYLASVQGVKLWFISRFGYE